MANTNRTTTTGLPLILAICLTLALNSVCLEIKIAVILPQGSDRPFSIERVSPAIDLALEFLERYTDMLRGHTVSVAYRDSRCSGAESLNHAINLYIAKKVDVFFGPVCDYAVAPLARQARYWDIPLLTAGAMANDFATWHQTEYQLLTRVGAVSFDGLSFGLIKIFTYFNMDRVKLIYDKSGQSDIMEGFCHLAISAVHHKLSNTESNITHDYYKLEKPNHIEAAMLAKEVEPVVVLCASADSVREIMIKAHDLNFDNGEYVFFNIDLFSSKDESKKPWYRHNDTEERNMKAKKAYEALMTVTLRKPTSLEYKNFSLEVKRRAKKRYKNFTYGEEEVNSFVGAFHDAVILYAHALNETLEANKSITDGKEITRRMWNRTFSGITGEVSIDANGDRNADYSLLDMDPETGEFEVVANYLGNTMQYKPVEGKQIRWAGGRAEAPPDTPKCGFDHSKCPPKEPFPKYGIVIIVLGALLVLVLVAAFFIYRLMKK